MTKKVFFSPHSDDAALFGAFTIQRERPLVVTLTDSVTQTERGLAITAKERRWEDKLAMEILGAHSIDFVGLPDGDGLDCDALRRVMAAYGHATEVWAPLPEQNGNRDHNKVGMLAAELFPGMVTFYLTYTTKGKSVKGKAVEIAEPRWVANKLRALACYESQMLAATGCQEHFLRDQREYYAEKDRPWKAILETKGKDWGHQ